MVEEISEYLFSIFQTYTYKSNISFYIIGIKSLLPIKNPKLNCFNNVQMWLNYLTQMKHIQYDEYLLLFLIVENKSSLNIRWVEKSN